MSFSVIAANYNKEHFLESFFDSFIGISEHIEYELIFIDDGSIDRSIQIADSYKCQLPLKIISLEKNQGPATARNIGIREATHSTIIFCDTDIAFKPSVLLEGYKLFLENNYDVLKNIFDYYKPNIFFSWLDVINLMEKKPNFFVNNKHIQRNEGMLMSTNQKIMKRKSAKKHF